MVKVPKSLRIPAGIALVVLVVWGIGVSRPIEHSIQASDQLGCVGPHLTQIIVLMIVGMTTGIAFGPQVRRGASAAAHAIMPMMSELRRTQAVRAAAILLIVANMVLVFPWLNSRVDQFVATHDALRAEIDMVVYVMGGFSGSAWAVLWKRYAWIGIILSLAMLYMVLANTLSRHAWC